MLQRLAERIERDEVDSSCLNQRPSGVWYIRTYVRVFRVMCFIRTLHAGNVLNGILVLARVN